MRKGRHRFSYDNTPGLNWITDFSWILDRESCKPKISRNNQNINIMLYLQQLTLSSGPVKLFICQATTYCRLYDQELLFQRLFESQRTSQGLQCVVSFVCYPRLLDSPVPGAFSSYRKTYQPSSKTRAFDFFVTCNCFHVTCDDNPGPVVKVHWAWHLHLSSESLHRPEMFWS